MACNRDPETDLDATILANAQGPAQASSDAGSFTQQKLTDLIEADRYLASKCAGSKTSRGLRFTKLVPPGAP